MSDAREFLTSEKAKALLGDKSEVHVILNLNGMLIGADWSRKEIDKLIDGAETIEIGGEGCREIKHPLVVFSGGLYHFLECELAP